MRPETWITEVFGTKAKTDVLRLLARDPHRTWTEREIAKVLSLSPNTVNLAARDLRNLGILEFHKIGQSHSIRLEPHLGISQRIGDVFDREADIWNDLQRSIRDVVPTGAACQLYGSTARGTATRTSDVDLLVVADSLEEAQELASRIRSAAAAVLPTALEIVALDRATARRRKHGRFMKNVLRDGHALSKTTLEELL